jgi:hypothetical protein
MPSRQEPSMEETPRAAEYLWIAVFVALLIYICERAV